MTHIYNGWISLHRKMLEWRWYTDNNTKAVFIHLLLTACWDKRGAYGFDLLRGQLITTYKRIAEETNLSIQNVRTAIRKLKSTNEIVVKSTNKFLLITVVKYSEYQSFDNNDNVVDDVVSVYEENRTSFKHKLEYDVLVLNYSSSVDIINNMIDILTDTVTYSKHIIVNDNEIPAKNFIAVFNNLSCANFESVLNSFLNNKNNIKNVKNYIISSLYNSVSTDALRVVNDVNSDTF